MDAARELTTLNAITGNQCSNAMADFGTGSEASEDKSLRRDHPCRGEKRVQITKGSTFGRSPGDIGIFQGFDTSRDVHRLTCDPLGNRTSGHCISPRLVCLSSWSLEVRAISATN
ncbi:hypothetical protein N7465_005188 [Penicillium sp. CMV-2018d]|nr:hypothetical protein N7465_005188 [Penicillium sp. CMV-2018d]